MTEHSPYNLITILGPTAGGKTSIAAHLAAKLNTEIISADSRQVYRKMNLGTGKDYEDYIIDGKKIPYHLIDIADSGTKYNVFEYQKDFFDVYQKLISSNKIPILCGGTGLYLESVISNYQLVPVPENPDLRKELELKSLDELSEILRSLKKLHNTTEVDTKKRAIRAIEIELFYKVNPKVRVNYPSIKSIVFGIQNNRQTQREKITQRLKQRLSSGLIDEVKSLIEDGVDTETLIYYGLEYKFVTLYITGQITYNQLFEQLNTAIHQFAKRQMTWFRRMESNGIKINWLDGMQPTDQKISQILEKL